MEIEQSSSLGLRLQAAALDGAREQAAAVQEAARDPRSPEVVVQLSDAAERLAGASGA